MRQIDLGIEIDIEMEITRAFEKFGAQYEVPDLDPILVNREGGVTAHRMAEEYEIPTASRARHNCQVAFARGCGSWGHILIEEVAEAIEAAVVGPESDFRAELIQVAAVAIRWITAIDERRQP